MTSAEGIGGGNRQAAQHADTARLLDAMLLVDTADEMFWAIRSVLCGHDWFDCWDSINEASALAVRAILAAGPPIMDAEWRAAGAELNDGQGFGPGGVTAPGDDSDADLPRKGAPRPDLIDGEA